VKAENAELDALLSMMNEEQLDKEWKKMEAAAGLENEECRS